MKCIEEDYKPPYEQSDTFTGRVATDGRYVPPKIIFDGPDEMATITDFLASKNVAVYAEMVSNQRGNYIRWLGSRIPDKDMDEGLRYLEVGDEAARIIMGHVFEAPNRMFCIDISQAEIDITEAVPAIAESSFTFSPNIPPERKAIQLIIDTALPQSEVA